MSQLTKDLCQHIMQAADRGERYPLTVHELRQLAYCASQQLDNNREAFVAGYAAAEADAKVCQVPPPGWRCTREAGHGGPCAAVEAPEDLELVERGMARLREATHQAKPCDRCGSPEQCAELGCAGVAMRAERAGRTELVAAWNDLPDSLRCHPGLKRLFRACQVA
jgi:hypothetical protein